MAKNYCKHSNRTPPFTVNLYISLFFESTRSPEHSPPCSPLIRRQRPATLYVKHSPRSNHVAPIKKISIPTVSVHEMATNAECLMVRPQIPPQQQLCPNSMVPPSSYAERFSRSASSSPRRGGASGGTDGATAAVVIGPDGQLRRRESVLQMLNRIWKSDECTRRPSVQKSNALDVPT
ncbi:hypothetical protein B9Z55_006780 [Caenorhabditis nigoni]|nr:hypothetical protein B9Z55_006780 [Caenorhabditis nigoni]